MLFHLVEKSSWDAARAAGFYRPASLESEGFIHLSTADQWQRTQERFYADAVDLLLLEIDETLLSAEIRYERVSGLGEDEDFPHLYGPLEVDAVVSARRVT